jgi:hypothetical protein
MAVMDPEHAQVARIGLSAVRDQGFALSGGQAFNAHGIGVRKSQDVDLFTDRQTDFGTAVGRLQTAYREEGYQVDIARQSAEFAQFELTKDGRTTQVDVGRDFRSRPPVETEVGPMISAEDAVGSKVGAVYERGEAKDYIDLEAAAQSGRYSRDDLLALGDEREVTEIDRDLFAEQLDQAGRIPDAKYAEHGLSGEQTAALKQDMSNWAQQLRTRAANPDMDNAMRLMESGHARPGSGDAVRSNGEADRRLSPYEQGRGMGERGS